MRLPFWHQLTQPIQQWWQYRPQREKTLLILAGILLVIFIGYNKIWLSHAQQTKEQTLLSASSKQQISWLHHAWAQLQTHQSDSEHKPQQPSPVANQQQLLSTLSGSLSQAKLDPYINSILPAQADSIHLGPKQQSLSISKAVIISVKSIPFAKLKKWLFDVAINNKMAVIKMDLKKSQPEGTVSGDLIVTI